MILPVATVVASQQLATNPVVRIQLDQMPVAELVTLLFRDVLRTPYVVAPEVIADRRAASVRLAVGATDARRTIVAYLRALGISVVNVGGVDQVSSIAKLSSSGSGPSFAAPPVDTQGDAPRAPASKPLVLEPCVYRPLHRDAGYLGDVLKVLFPDLHLASRGEVQAGGTAVFPQPVPDLLVFSAPAETVGKAKAVLRDVDTPVAQLSIKATVYEVQTGHTNATALQLAFNVLGNKLSVGSLASSTPFDSVLKIATANVGLVFSALNQDSRFHVLTAPTVVTRSGAQAALTSGSQVPVLGAVSYPGASGNAVQSVEYRDSGVIFKVRPSVHRDVIDLDVSEELSSFVRTSTGVNNSPTLNKRSLINQLALRSGDVVAIGGLIEDSDNRTRSGILPGILGAKSHEKARTEVLLVLQVTVLPEAVDLAPARSGASTGGVVVASAPGTAL